MCVRRDENAKSWVRIILEMVSHVAIILGTLVSTGFLVRSGLFLGPCLCIEVKGEAWTAPYKIVENLQRSEKTTSLCSYIVGSINSSDIEKVDRLCDLCIRKDLEPALEIEGNLHKLNPRIIVQIMNIYDITVDYFGSVKSYDSKNNSVKLDDIKNIESVESLYIITVENTGSKTSTNVFLVYDNNTKYLEYEDIWGKPIHIDCGEKEEVSIGSLPPELPIRIKAWMTGPPNRQPNLKIRYDSKKKKMRILTPVRYSANLLNLHPILCLLATLSFGGTFGITGKKLINKLRAR